MANPKPVGKSTPIIGGVLTFALFGIHRLFVGQIYSRSEAVSLVEALSDSSLYFGSAIASASATILALMLTMLGMMHNSSADIGIWLFKRVRMIAWFATISLCSAVALLTFSSIPIGEFEDIPTNWYVMSYYAIATLMAVVAGLLVTSILLILGAVRYLVNRLAPEVD